MPVPSHTNPRDQLHQEIAKIRGQLDDALATIAELRERYEPIGMYFPATWRLTGKETKLLHVLFMVGGLLSKQQLLSALYDNDVDEPDIKIVDVFVCKMRKKLAPHGITIDTVWGQGYRIAHDVRVVVEAGRAAAVAGLPFTSPLPPVLMTPGVASGRWHRATPEETEQRKEMGRRITKRREYLGLTRGEVGTRVGCGATYMWVIESGGASDKATKKAQEVLRDWKL